MKYIRLLNIFFLCLSFLSECSQLTQSVPNASWWERSKGYAASWIPQIALQKAKKVRHVLLKKWLNQSYPLSLIFRRFMGEINACLFEMFLIKRENQETDITTKINDLINLIATDTMGFDLQLIVDDAFNDYPKIFKDFKFTEKDHLIFNELRQQINQAIAHYEKNNLFSPNNEN